MFLSLVDAIALRFRRTLNGRQPVLALDDMCPIWPCRPVPVPADDRSKYDENVKQSHQLDSEPQQMHSINK